MAIDTEDKRRSILDMDLGTGALPIPNDDIDQADRQHMLELYRGILADPPPENSANALFVIGQ